MNEAMSNSPGSPDPDWGAEREKQRAIAEERDARMSRKLAEKNKV